MRAGFAALVAALLAAFACGPGSPDGPSMDNRMSQPELAGPEIQSNDILARGARANEAKVKHVLISWQGKGKDPRAQARSRSEADALASSLLERIRAGEPIEPLMAEYSEDPGSTDGTAYDVTPSAELIFEFKRLALRLERGEAGLVLSSYGWHVMKRVD